MSTRTGPNASPGRRWGIAAAFAVVAALPPIILLALEAGALARVQATISGAKLAASQPSLSTGPGADTIAWAWAVFFAVLAIVFVKGDEPAGGAASQSEDIGGYVILDPVPELRSSVLELSKGDSAEPLPAVQNLEKAQAWFRKGSEQYGLGLYEEAISSFDRALRLYPRLASAWGGKGLAYDAKGLYRDAISCYDESLRLDPRDPEVWHAKGMTLTAMGRLEGALNCFNEALMLSMRDARAWNNKGVCLAGLGRLDEAIACYDKALTFDRSYALAWHAKAMAQEQLGQIPEAIAAFKKYIDLAPGRAAATIERVRRHVSALEAGPQPSA